MRGRLLVGLGLVAVAGGLIIAMARGLLPSSPMWTLVLTSTLTIPFAVFADLIASWWGKSVDGNGDQRGILVRHCLVDERNTLPQVGKVDQPALVGVHARAAATSTYVRRDVDEVLDGMLRTARVLVVQGPHGSGRSRAAFEALRRVHPRRTLVVPRDPASFVAVVEANIPLRRAVLWLDELDTFIMADRVDRFLLHRLASHRTGPLVIVGTRLDTAPATGLLSEFLDGADVVSISDVWTEAEQQRFDVVAATDAVLGGVDRAAGDGRLLVSLLADATPPPRPPVIPSQPPGPRALRPSIPAPPLCLGRDGDVAEVATAVAAQPPVPIWVHGAPGIGKSTVLRAALHHPAVVERFGPRRFFVRCGGETQADAILAEIAVALHIPIGQGLMEAVIDALAAEPTLLALDELATAWEHDRDQVEDLLDQLVAIPGLGLAASIRGASSPSVGFAVRRVMLRPLDQAVARQMFLSIAGDEYSRDHHLGDLVAAQDGVPLALKLLATVAQGEPNLRGLWRRWTTQRSLVTDGFPGPDGMDVSVELTLSSPRMNGVAHRLLTALGALPDGIDLDDLQRLMPGTADTAAATLRRVGLAFDDQGRLRTLAPIRDYVARERPMSTDLRSVVLEHYLDLAKQFGSQVVSDNGAQVSARLVAESGNLDATVRIGLTDDDPAAAIQAACALGEFTRWSGIGDTELLEAAAEASHRIGDLALEGECLYRLGDIALRRCELDDAQRFLTRALPLFEASGDVQWQAHTVKHIGDTAFEQSEFQAALPSFEQAAELYRAVGDRRGEARCFKTRGDVSERLSEYDDAIRLFEAALVLVDEIGDRLEAADLSRRLGDVALAINNVDEADRRYAEALAWYQGTGVVLGRANCIRGQGQVALARGDFEAARAAVQRAEPLYARMRYRRGQADCVTVLGEIAVARGELAPAVDLFDVALDLYSQLSDTIGQATCRLGIAVATADPQVAVSMATAALADFERVGRRDGVAQAHVRLSALAQDAGVADGHVQAARAIWQAQGRADRLALLEQA
ncbi:tetratricopeptide repeat protein [Dactylosporangium siamense]|uniref:ORC1/DEAH AAA+ ATPase domain-containing protein n=1 Tax=Dactylosporangium siamense TaxID=685454 RepID=A0A919UEJ5_9ACTN|nr:tetratricopeptide repeat protein [Dactylosporangium siamense]GIG48700.1 hypothetical protein Dsi01nite_067410 [Dactylosporangium siamense]